MSLPYVRINFANGAIGGSAAMDDGCTGLICNAAAVSGQLRVAMAESICMSLFPPVLTRASARR